MDGGLYHDYIHPPTLASSAPNDKFLIRNNDTLFGTDQFSTQLNDKLRSFEETVLKQIKSASPELIERDRYHFIEQKNERYYVREHLLKIVFEEIYFPYIGIYQLRKFRIAPVMEKFVDSTGEQTDVVYELTIGHLIIAVGQEMEMKYIQSLLENLIINDRNINEIVRQCHEIGKGSSISEIQQPINKEWLSSKFISDILVHHSLT